jgi:hypothetical protein
MNELHDALNVRGWPAVDIALSKRCSIYKPQAVPALSSDHNSIVFKIHLHPAIAKTEDNV